MIQQVLRNCQSNSNFKIVKSMILASVLWLPLFWGCAPSAIASSYGEMMPASPTKSTYSATTNGLFTPLASATDIVTFAGSTSKTVKIQKIYICYELTISSSASLNNFFLVKRSTADSGGTPTTETITPLDSNNPAATAVMKSYRSGTNPSLGSTTGTIWCGGLVGTINNYLVVNPQTNYVLAFDAAMFGQPIVLRGTSECICLNNNGATVVGASPKVGMMVIFTEE